MKTAVKHTTFTNIFSTKTQGLVQSAIVEFFIMTFVINGMRITTKKNYQVPRPQQ
jgi:hypothetical protein